MLQGDSVSIKAGDAGGASLGAAESGGAAAALNNVMGISWCAVETGSSEGGASGITAEREGSGAEASGNGTTGCSSIKDGNETGSDSRAASSGSDRGGTRRSPLKELGTSLEKVGGSAGREGSSDRRTGVGHGRSGSLIASASAIDLLISLTLGGSVDGSGSGSLNETGGSGFDVVMDGAEGSGSGTDSG